VQPTVQAKGLAVNDDKDLEAEADKMGKQASQGNSVDVSSSGGTVSQKKENKTIQRETPNVKEISFEDEPLSVTADVARVGRGRSGNDQVDSELNRWQTAIGQYFSSWRDGLNSFETAMSFSSEQDASPKGFLDTVFKTGFKWGLGKLVSLAAAPTGPIGIALVEILKSSIENQFAEEGRASAAGGEVAISTYIQEMRSKFTPTETALLASIENKRIPMADSFSDSLTIPEIPGTGSVVGGGASFLNNLRRNVSSIAQFANEVTPDQVQQFISERFVCTNEFSGPITQGGDTSGNLHMELHVYKDGGDWEIESMSNWKLLTSAPNASQAAFSLQESLQRQGLKPWESHLEKKVHLTVEDEEWGFNEWHDCLVFFDNEPKNFSMRGLYKDNPKLLQAGFRLSIDRLKSKNKINGGTTR
jgi:hypothetical protein